MKILLFSILSFNSFSAEEVALSMIPRGKVIERYGREYIVKTISGSKIQVEFTLEGKFQEAFGKNLNQGDQLEPGEGLLSLSSAAFKLKERGFLPQGHWTIEKDDKLGWIYEFRNAVMNAKTGEVLRVLKDSEDDVP